MRIKQTVLISLFLFMLFSFFLSSCTSMISALLAPGTGVKQTDLYGKDISAGESSQTSGFSWLMSLYKQLALTKASTRSAPVFQATKPGYVSITGNKDFFESGSSDFFNRINRSSKQSFFKNNNIQINNAIKEHTKYQEHYKHFNLSMYLSGVYKISPSLDEYPWLWGYVGPGIEWSPVPHFGLGLRLGDAPPVDNNLEFININVYYYFKGNGLEGLYLGGEMNHFWSNDENGEDSISDLYFQPKIGYKLTLLDFISIDFGAGYGLGFLVFDGEDYHGPSASISTGVSF